MRAFAFVLTAVVLASAAARAGDQGGPEQSCDGSTAEIVECLKTKTAERDKRLNTAYQKAIEAAQGRQREQLRKAQRLWVPYRDANCLYFGLGEGTIARIEAADCMYRMTRSRAEELEAAIESN